MFLAKIFDQRQGESRVVDQQQVLRERLDQWLKARPSAADLAERGILGRPQRYALARAVVDRLLQARLRSQEEERTRIPAGSFAYAARTLQLLAGPADGADAGGAGGPGGAAALPPPEELERRRRELAGERSAQQAGLEAAAGRWRRAAEACRGAACTRTLPDAVADAGRVLRDLEAHREWAGGSLAGVFEELGAFQRLLAKKYGLQRVVAMVERTEAVREAAFAWGGAEALPLETLEELPGLCAGLPRHSRAVGLGRLRFVLGPVRTALLHSLQEALRATGRWPLEAGAATAAAPEIARGSAELRAVQLCADLQRVQGVEREMRRLAGTAPASGEKAGGADLEAQDWACSALAAPLIARFRHHFWRPESELCRMDKPEWAFRYLLDLLSEHSTEVGRWAAAAEGESAGLLTSAQLEALRKADLPVGLALSLAHEARLFVRSRMPVLVPKEARPLLLHTIHHFVHFHGDVSSHGGSSAGAAAFADFDGNRPVFPEDGEQSGACKGEGRAAAASSTRLEGAQAGRPEVDSRGPAAEPGGAASSLLAGIAHLRRPGPEQPAANPRGEQERQNDSKIGAVSARLMAGISQLRPLAPGPGSAEGATAGQGGCGLREQEGAPDAGPGCLDAWAAADHDFVSERIAAATAGAGQAWRPSPVRLGPAAAGAGGAEPQAGELATLVGDLFERARERAGCLASERSRAAYAERVLTAGLQQAVAAVRRRWNALEDPVQEAQEAALVLETLEQLCRFLDSFPLAVHVVAAVDEAGALRVSMLEALVGSLEDSVRKALRSVSVEPGLFTFALAPALAAFSRRLRPSNFLGLARQLVGRLAASLFGQLLRQSPFSGDDELALFVGNCGEDLRGVLAAVLGAEDLRPARPLWDACALLGLPLGEATELLALLKRALQSSSGLGVAPAHRGGPGSAAQEDGEARAAAAPARRLPDALAEAGVEELSAPDALTVLAKRPDLAGAAADVAGAPFGVLQELLPVGAAQATLQLGTGAIQQLGAQGAGALQGLGLPSALPISGAQASLQTGMAELKGLAGDAGRLFTGTLRSTLGRGAA